MFFLRSLSNTRALCKIFSSGNVLVAGTKGKGKDMLFSLVIRRREKLGVIHAANIRYTAKTKIRPIAYYSLENNSRANFVYDNFETETKLFTEREDFYISEAGLALPSHDFRKLEKEYPTFPIVYALSRHLGEFNIHANAQEFTRVWDKLREQADYFIWCESCCIVVGRLVRQQFIVYNRRESAFQHIQPFKVRQGLFRKNKDDLANAQVFNAQHGLVKRMVIWHVLPKQATYDTRAFYEKLYKKKSAFINGKKRSKS